MAETLLSQNEIFGEETEILKKQKDIPQYSTLLPLHMMCMQTLIFANIVILYTFL